MTTTQYITHLSTLDKTFITIFAMNCNKVFTGIDLETIHKITNEQLNTDGFFIIILVVEAQYSKLTPNFAKQTKPYSLQQNYMVFGCVTNLTPKLSLKSN